MYKYLLYILMPLNLFSNSNAEKSGIFPHICKVLSNIEHFSYFFFVIYKFIWNLTNMHFNSKQSTISTEFTKQYGKLLIQSFDIKDKFYPTYRCMYYTNFKIYKLIQIR